jgi:hypothetical protein
MAPTREEELKLREFREDALSKLGTAESFLKAVLGVPFAFKRAEAMLYIANFDSEVDYLKTAFRTLEVLIVSYLVLLIALAEKEGTAMPESSGRTIVPHL